MSTRTIVANLRSWQDARAEGYAEGRAELLTELWVRSVIEVFHMRGISSHLRHAGASGLPKI